MTINQTILTVAALALASGCAGNGESSEPTNRIPPEFQGSWQTPGRACHKVTDETGSFSSRFSIEVGESDMVQTLNVYSDSNCQTLGDIFTAHYEVQHVEDQGEKGIIVQLKEESDETESNPEKYQVSLKMRLKGFDLDVRVANVRTKERSSAGTLAEYALGSTNMQLNRIQ